MSPTRRHNHYDAVIVGARAAGAATGMLLARAGLRVLILERSQYGDDTMSTHALMRGAVMQLHRWGLLPRLLAAGTPPLRRTTFFVGPDPLVIPIKPAHGIDALYAPRRCVLDPILADAAVAAGAEVRFGTRVTGVLRDRTGRVSRITGHDIHRRPFTASATITIGADGMSSSVAHWVDAPVSRASTATGAVAYGYWDGVGTDSYECFFRPGAAAGVIPTNSGSACVFVETTPERFRTDLVRDPSAGYRALLAEAAPELTERLAQATPPSKLVRFPGRPGYLRRPWGPGWALVGDAGYFKDPISAHGLTDALRDAELLARAVIAGARGGNEFDALAEYESTRDRLSEPLFTVTDAIASFRWNEREIGELLMSLSASMADEVDLLAVLGDPVELAS